MKYKGLIISGIPGVGKSYLETQLSKYSYFYRLPKYTDRMARPSEKKSSTVSISSEEYASKLSNNEFLHTVKFMNHSYGWLKKDAEKHSSKILTLSLTPSALEGALESLPGFIPVFLAASTSEFDLIRERMRKRESWQDMGESERKMLDVKISAYLELSREDIGSRFGYEMITDNYAGKTFDMTSDNTVHDEVIPWVLKKFGV
jgi:guanylate kinase